MYAEVLYTTSKINHRILKIHDLDSSFYSHRSRCHDPDEERVRQRRVRREDPADTRRNPAAGSAIYFLRALRLC